jgi:hypothetical protein
MDGAARARVQALGVLPDDDKVQIGQLVLADRSADARPQLGWPEIDIQIKLEPQAQQQSAFEHARRHVGSPDRSEQDRVGLPQLGEYRVRQHLAGAQIVLPAEPAAPPLDAEPVLLRHEVDAPPGYLGYLGSDAVTRQMGYDVGPAGYISRCHSSISFAAGFSQLIMLRSGLPTCSICAVLASVRSRSKFGRPLSSSATHSRANSPD